MKRILLLIALLALSCTKAPLHQAEPEAEYSGTRTDVRLEGTIWEHRTGEDFDRYVLFQNGTASLFYGIAEDGALHRYSDFYTAPYTYQDGALRTSISYPPLGEPGADGERVRRPGRGCLLPLYRRRPVQLLRHRHIYSRRVMDDDHSDAGTLGITYKQNTNMELPYIQILEMLGTAFAASWITRVLTIRARVRQERAGAEKAETEVRADQIENIEKLVEKVYKPTIQTLTDKVDELQQKVNALEKENDQLRLALRNLQQQETELEVPRRRGENGKTAPRNQDGTFRKVQQEEETV